jgi:anti-sigma factor RsiW
MNRFLNNLKCWLRLPSCMRTHRLLFDYVQGNLDKHTTHKLDAHLGDCPECLQFVRTYRQTIAAAKNHYPGEVEIPPALKEKLEQFIAKEL